MNTKSRSFTIVVVLVLITSLVLVASDADLLWEIIKPSQDEISAEWQTEVEENQPLVMPAQVIINHQTLQPTGQQSVQTQTNGTTCSTQVVTVSSLIDTFSGVYGIIPDVQTVATTSVGGYTLPTNRHPYYFTDMGSRAAQDVVLAMDTTVSLIEEKLGVDEATAKTIAEAYLSKTFLIPPQEFDKEVEEFTRQNIRDILRRFENENQNYLIIFSRSPDGTSKSGGTLFGYAREEIHVGYGATLQFTETERELIANNVYGKSITFFLPESSTKIGQYVKNYAHTLNQDDTMRLIVIVDTIQGGHETGQIFYQIIRNLADEVQSRNRCQFIDLELITTYIGSSPEVVIASLHNASMHALWPYTFSVTAKWHTPNWLVVTQELWKQGLFQNALSPASVMNTLCLPKEGLAGSLYKPGTANLYSDCHLFYGNDSLGSPEGIFLRQPLE